MLLEEKKKLLQAGLAKQEAEQKRLLEKESSQGDATQLATVLEDTERTPLFKKLAIDWGGMLGH
mgnify:CR=1 FL=1